MAFGWDSHWGRWPTNVSMCSSLIRTATLVLVNNDFDFVFDGLCMAGRRKKSFFLFDVLPMVLLVNCYRLGWCGAVCFLLSVIPRYGLKVRSGGCDLIASLPTGVTWCRVLRTVQSEHAD
ncbi:MAG: hypothetical protein Q9P14_09860 [candidate division KSB1 bacterium]|nr:hypothetical protein [candidate division KSB1 bacterium]